MMDQRVQWLPDFIETHEIQYEQVVLSVLLTLVRSQRRDLKSKRNVY